MAQSSISSFFKPKRKHEDSENDKPCSKIVKLTSDSIANRWKISSSWESCLLSEMNKEYFVSLEKFVDKERNVKCVYPSHDEVFSWTQHCSFKDVKVIILGQDPYHGPNQAHGLCFSVKVGVTPPPSLKNIYKCLVADIDAFKSPSHGYLVGWAKQGVLMLNAVLTVEKGKPNSHKNRGWEKVTDHVIKYISKELDHCVFLLWGSPAIKKQGLINKSNHLILTAVHPSPLSAHRGFLDCKHFSKANEYLQEHNKATIDWSDLPSV